MSYFKILEKEEVILGLVPNQSKVLRWEYLQRESAHTQFEQVYVSLTCMYA